MVFTELACVIHVTGIVHARMHRGRAGVGPTLAKPTQGTGSSLSFVDQCHSESYRNINQSRVILI